MIVRLTGKHDKEILKHIETVGFCTAQQIAKIFYKNSSQGEAIARRRLNRMVEAKYLNVKKLDNYSNRNIYYFNNDKNKNFKPSLHKTILLDYYAKLLNNGVDIQYFKQEQFWMNGKIKSDGFCVYIINNKIFADLIEVDTSNNNRNIEKYNKLYDSGEVHKITSVFPRIVLIDEYRFTNPKLKPEIKVIQLNYELNPFSSLFIN